MSLLCASVTRGQSNQVVRSGSSSIQYVSPAGKDLNDGHDWGSAKRTVMAAYDALPGKGGTIYIVGDSNISGSSIACVNVTPTSGQGFGIAGSIDPNYKLMPKVLNNIQWVKYKRVAFIGIPSNTGGTSLNFPGVCVLAGNSTTDALRLSGANAGIGFFNLIFVTGAKRGLVIGEDSNGGRTGLGVWSGLKIENDTFTVNTENSANGPAIDCTGGSYQLYFSDFSANANTTALVKSNTRAAFLMDGASPNYGCGLLTIRDAHFNGGGLRYTGQPTATSFAIDGVICEAQLNGDACIHLLTASGVTAIIKNIDVADCTGTVPGVQVDPTPGNTQVGLIPDNVTTENINSACVKNIQGEMIGIGQWTQNLGALRVSPEREGQTGVIRGHVIGQQDSSRAAFGPSAVRYKNLVNPVSGYTISRGGALTTAISAPDGTSGAVQGAYDTSSGAVIFLNTSSIPLSVNDFLLAGAWVRSANAHGYAGGVVNVMQLSVLGAGSNAATLIQHGAPWMGDGEWEWVWQLQKVTSVGATPIVQLNVQYDSGNTIQAYAPILIRIPAGSVSANEAFRIAYNLQTYSPACAVGTVCGIAGQTEAPAHLGQTTANQFAGTATLSRGKVTVVFPSPYRETPVCVANDTTSASSGVKPAPTAARVEFSGAENDSISYICVGNPN
jgi:hypothetical protein